MWKVLLVAAVVLVGLGVATVGYIVPRIKVHETKATSGDRVRVDTPFGTVSVDEHKNMKADVGDIPIYPGAEQDKQDHGGATVDIDWGSGEKQISVAAVQYSTADSVTRVRDWYRERLPNWKVSNRELTHTDGGMRRIVSVKEKEGRTIIGIATIGEPPSN